jgi:general secretion pathway protein H
VSALDTARCPRTAGFTLIEILVSMAIVGVLSATLVFVAAPGDARLAKTEARRLALLLELALADARAGGQSIAWAPAQDGYTFWRKADDGEWRRFPEDSPYRRRQFPGAILLRQVRFDTRALAADERVILSRHGLGGALQATITGGNASFTLRGGAFGRIALTSDIAPGAHAKLPAEGPRLHPG